MTKKQQEEFLNLIEKGTLRALNSDEGKKAILKVLGSKESKDIFLEVFVEAFHDVVVPTIENLHENHEKRIQKLEIERKIH